MNTIEKAIKDYANFLDKQYSDQLGLYRTKYNYVVFSNGTTVKLDSNASAQKYTNPFEDDDFLNTYSENLNKNLVFESPTFHEVLTQTLSNFKKVQKEYPEFSKTISKAYEVFLGSKFPNTKRELCVIHPLDLTYDTVYGTPPTTNPSVNTSVNTNIFVLNRIEDALKRIEEVYKGKPRIFEEDVSIQELSLSAVHLTHQETCTTNHIRDYTFPRVIAIITFDRKVTFFKK